MEKEYPLYYIETAVASLILASTSVGLVQVLDEAVEFGIKERRHTIP